MFSSLSRAQWAMRVGKVDLEARLLCEQLMLGHLFVLVIGQRSRHPLPHPLSYYVETGTSL
jgi:hypothetical protein